MLIRFNDGASAPAVLDLLKGWDVSLTFKTNWPGGGPITAGDYDLEDGGRIVRTDEDGDLVLHPRYGSEVQRHITVAVPLDGVRSVTIL
jgi:hypothetical protein